MKITADQIKESDFVIGYGSVESVVNIDNEILLTFEGHEETFDRFNYNEKLDVIKLSDKQVILDHLEFHKYFYSKIEQIVTIKQKYENKEASNGDIDKVFDDDDFNFPIVIRVRENTSCRGCWSEETDTYYISEEEFFMKIHQLRSKLHKEKKERIALTEAKKEADKANYQKIKDQQELEEFERLKAKFQK